MNVIAPRMLFLGSFPPRECGIATFTKDVVESYDTCYATHSEIVAIEELDATPRSYPPAVVACLIQDDRASYRHVAEFVNAHPSDALNIQHEYGLFGGEEGEWVVDLIALVSKPTIVTLHTVLPDPTSAHLRVARTICAAAAAIVVLSRTGKDILVERYGIDPSKVHVVHHGVPDVAFCDTAVPKATIGLGPRCVISTFGLINRGKGLEYAIEAMRDIVVRHPDALYLILGETHPVVLRHEGEAYRESLVRLVTEYQLENNIRLIGHYLAFDELVRYLQATDVYLSPYLNPVQIASGTLAYAVGCGKAIASTPYLYAQELLAHGRGLLVNFRDARSIVGAVSALLDDPELRASTERRAYQFGRQMTWPHVATEYGRLFSSLLPCGRAELATAYGYEQEMDMFCTLGLPGVEGLEAALVDPPAGLPDTVSGKADVLPAEGAKCQRSSTSGDRVGTRARPSPASGSMRCTDSQMPNIGGISATKAIRNEERRNGGHVPILR